MNGIIVTYGAKTSLEITKLNNFLFGRVAIVNRGNIQHHYYYPGLLDHIKYYKLSSGCYFIHTIDVSIFLGQSVLILPTSGLKLENSDLITAREYFKNKYSDVKVNNI